MPWDPRPSGSDNGSPGPSSPSSKDSNTAAPSPTPIPKAPSSQPIAHVATLETYLTDGQVIPARLRAASLVVHFRSNDSNATFECATAQGVTSQAFAPCASGNSYDFGQLIHSHAYSLNVRARTPDGRIAQKPLAISFVCDMLDGDPIVAPSSSIGGTLAAGVVIPQSVNDLPAPGQPGAMAPMNGMQQNPSLLVGGYYAVAVPPDASVISYSTTKNVNATLHTMRLMAQGLSSLTPDRPCDQNYEQVVPGPGNSRYCDATPPQPIWLNDAKAGKALPENHIQLARAAKDGVTDERVLVAAFDADTDPTEQHLGINDYCAGAFYKGTSAVAVLNQFYGLSPTTEAFSWCQVRDAQGQYWWIGTFAAALSGGAADGPRLKVIYSANARLGFFSGPQFAVQAGRRLPALIVPLAPVAASK